MVICGNNAVHGALAAYVLHQCARIYIVDGYYIVLYEVVFEAVIGYHARIAVRYVFADKPADLYRVAFHIVILHTIVAYVGVVHDEHLAGVGGVCENFLVARHACIKAYFATCGALSAK